MFKKLVCIFFAVMLVLSTVSTAFAEGQLPWPSYNRCDLGYIEGTVISHNVTVRTSPSESASRVTSLTNGQYVKINRELDGWYEIKLDNGEYGYLLSSYVMSDYRTLYLLEGAPIYPYPGSSKRIGYLSSGEFYTILGETQDYWIINVRAACAFISKNVKACDSSSMEWTYKYAEQTRGFVVQDSKVYASNNSGSKVLGTIPAGSNVMIVEFEQNYWYKVLFTTEDGAQIVGWIHENMNI